MMININRKVLIGLLLLSLPLGLLAQTYQPIHRGMSNWYFGATSNALKFNRANGLPSTVNNKIALGRGGSATATDATNSNLLFYTDGANVYDACHLLMQNGSGLLANPSSNQPVAVCPVPGAPNKYFIFSNSATSTTSGTITYDIVDLGLLGNSLFPSTVPLGDLEAPFHQTLGLTGRAEAMEVVPHSNGVDYWLFTQVANSQDYSATLITAASYNLTHTGTFSTTTTSGLGLTMSASHFSFYNGGLIKKLAVAPTTSSTDAILLNFAETTPTTGAFTSVQTINNSASAGANNQAIYDIEWSGDGHYVYYSIFGDEATGVTGNVFQFDATNPTITLASVLPSTVFRSYGLQLAPDSSIYHLYQRVSGGPLLIGKISDPDSIASKTNYNAAPFAGVADWGAQQFSAVLPLIKPVVTVAFTVVGNCQNSPTGFYPTVVPYADSLVWDFADGDPRVNAWSPVHTYQNAGTFAAQVTAFFQGQAYPQPAGSIVIDPFPITLQLTSDTTACTFEFPPPKGTSGPPQFSVTVTASGGTPTSYIWSNGDTGATLTPDSAGYYYVVASNGSGCSAYAGVNVKEYGVPDQRANIWYFGNKAGIDFNTPIPTALSDGQMNAPEGCSAMSDRNGEIIFYTDGDNVYDQTHALIATGIGGDPTSSQSALIVPVPGDETLYYIFTTESSGDYPTNSIYFSLFDLKKNNGKGDITIQKQLLYSGSTERLASNGNWLLTHEFGNNSFRCFQITPAGLGQPVISSIGSDHSYKNPSLGEGYMKIGSGTRVAVPLSIPGTSNWIEVFDLDNTTGLLSNYRKVDLKEPNGQAYGVEFSPGGNKMFATVKGTPSPSLIFEYSIDSLDQLHFKQKFSDVKEFGALQIAPDGQIYLAINGSATLGSVVVNEDTTQLSTFNLAAFTLAAGKVSNLGLPSFVQQTGSAFNGPGMSVLGFCFGTPMDYSASPTDPIDTFLWGFGDGGTSSLQSGQHSYAAIGNYTVTLVINNRCLIHDKTAPFSFSQNIKIVRPPATPTIPANAALCTTALVLDANTSNATGLTYSWNTTETTKQISVNAVGIYSVVIADAFGCTSTGSTDLQDARPVVNLGPDQTICEGVFVPTLNAQNPAPAFSHVWTLDGVANGNTTPNQTVSTSTPGTDTYKVTVTNIATNCITIEDVKFIFTESPNFSIASTGTTLCGTLTGSLALTITPLTQTAQPPTHTFSYDFFGAPTPIPSASAVAPGVFNFPNLLGGTYSVQVGDEISGCALLQTVSINDPTNTLSLTAPPASVCAASQTSLSATTNVIGAFTYDVFSAAGGPAIVTGAKNSANFTTLPIGPGTYTLQVTSAASCIASLNNIVVGLLPPLPFTTSYNACGTAPIITGTTAGLTYSWAGINAPSTSNIQSFNTSSLTLKKNGGAYSYTVTASDGSCASSNQIDIVIDPAIVPTLSQTNECQNQVTVTANPPGYSYLWYSPTTPRPTPDVTLLGQQITLTSGGVYHVDVLSAATGCKYPAQLNVKVIGPITAAISSTPACDNGGPFTISAFTNSTKPTYSWTRGSTNLGVSIDKTTQTLPGNYKVKVTEGTCSAEASIQLILGPIPQGSLPAEAIICDDPENADPTTDHIDLSPGQFAGYQWFVRKTIESPETNLNFTDSVYTVEKKGIYRVRITNTFGCQSEDITTVLNDCVPKIVAPNAFKPSSNVVENKNFFAITKFITEDFNIFIFNRWGELVYESADRNFEWNGGYNNDAGTPLPSGAYAFLIQYVSSFRPDQGVQEKRGGVVLLR